MRPLLRQLRRGGGDRGSHDHARAGRQGAPGTGGYLCQKAQRLACYADHRDRLTSPLRRRPDGRFEEVGWDVALGEIAERLLAVRREHGGGAFAFVGGGGQGNHLNAIRNDPEWEKLLYLLPGHFGRPGTNNLHGWLLPLWGNSKGERAAVSGQEQIAGLYPPARLAGEVLADSPDRTRVLWVDSSNPANTYPDTAAVEEALRAAELTVVVDVALTETAALADYVLPAASQYEKWEYTLFNFDFPANTFHLRAPLFDPLPGTLPEPEIYSRLLRRMGTLPADGDLADLRRLAGADRAEFRKRLFAFLATNPELGPVAPVVLYETLGRTLPGGAAGAAPLWLGCHHVAKEHADAVRRALGATEDGFALGEALFERVLGARSGTVFAEHEYEDVWKLVRHKDAKVRLAVPEMLDWLRSLDPAAEQPDPEYPFVAAAGQRRAHNANQILRDPAWRKSDPDGALRVHPDDLVALGATAGGWVAVETRAGRLVARAEADDGLRRGYVSLPHGYGQAYPDAGGERLTDGPRVNLITSADDCDPIAATPHHRNVAVRLVAVTGPEADAAEERSRRVAALAGAPAAG